MILINVLLEILKQMQSNRHKNCFNIEEKILQVNNDTKSLGVQLLMFLLFLAIIGSRKELLNLKY